MLGSFDLLPSELLESVLDKLPTDAVINLWRTNTCMSNRINNHLFGHPAALNHVKAWACKRGDVDVLLEAIVRDGDPNFYWKRRDKSLSNYIPSIRTNWLSEKLKRTSTLLKAIVWKSANSLSALLDMGATFEALDDCNRARISFQIRARIERMPPDMVDRLAEAKLGSWVLGRDGFLMDFIREGAPVEILRSVAEGQDLDVIKPWGSSRASSALSAAIDNGKGDIVSLLSTMGANINGSVEIQRIPDTAWYSNEICRPQPIRCSRPYHVPIFAAARHMAKTGSTEMLDVCLRHGADINQRSPAFRQHQSRIDHFTTTPLMSFLESITNFPIQSGFDSISGIKYFISHGANIQRNESVDRWYFGTTTWLNVSSEDQCLPYSMVELLLYKWNLQRLHEPQFLNTIKYLIAQGSGINRADKIVSNFSFDSIVTSFPLPQSHADHPENVPMWWDVVQQLWDKLDEVHGHSYAWMQHSLELQAEGKNLIAAGIMTQEERDRLLYTSFINQGCLYFPQFYGTLRRLVLDRQIELGADINAAVGDRGETLLFYVCDQINSAFVTGETNAIDSDYQYPEHAQLFHVKLKELVLSLINKGADPRKSVDEWTPYTVLQRDVEKASLKNKGFLVHLGLEIKEAREEFLKNGSMTSLLVKRVDMLDLRPIEFDCIIGKMYCPRDRVKWEDFEVI